MIDEATMSRLGHARLAEIRAFYVSDPLTELDGGLNA